MTTQASKTTCWIPKSHLPALKVKVEALDRKAAKLGMKPFSIEVLEETVKLRIPANVTGHSGDRDRFAHGLHAGESFVR